MPGPRASLSFGADPAGDGAVLDARSRARAVLPGPAPQEGDKFPPNKTYFEVPLAIQDRSFNADGSLFYPDTRSSSTASTGRTCRTRTSRPSGTRNSSATRSSSTAIPGVLDVQQRRYRFRLLNGCNLRFLILDFSAIPGVQVTQIGNEGGFLAASWT